MVAWVDKAEEVLYKLQINRNLSGHLPTQVNKSPPTKFFLSASSNSSSCSRWSSPDTAAKVTSK